MRLRTLMTGAVLLGTLCSGLQGQEGPVATQALVAVDSKTNTAPALQQMTVKVDGKTSPLAAWRPAMGANGQGVQVAVLMDDGLRESVGRQIDDLKQFVTGLPPGVQIYFGYMRNGMVVPAQEFTTDHAAAAQQVRLPTGMPGISGSPYFCLSAFVNHWPSNQSAARFVLMITNGVDPYNGSDSPLNQDSPNVDRAVTDAQRAGVAVYSIYYSDAGRMMRTMAASNSGQDYLTQVAAATGGVAYIEGMYSPVAMLPYLKRFQSAVAETYVASFTANAEKNRLVNVKFSTKASNTKLEAPDKVLPGNRE